MAKVTFLLGAGASANALPIVNLIPTSLFKFKQSIETILTDENKKNYDEFFEDLATKRIVEEKSFLADLNDIIEKVSDHASIDTYAKKLRITGNSISYKKLKAVFSAYLIYTQLKNAPDKRYDSFFASILGTNCVDFISNINILSWNYDIQLKKAYSSFSESPSLANNQLFLNVNFKGQDNIDDKNKIAVHTNRIYY